MSQLLARNYAASGTSSSLAGDSLAAVGTGALIVKESDHFHAEGMSSAAFRHGPFEMLSEDTFVVIFSGDEKTRDLNRRLLADIQQDGGRAEFIGENSSMDRLSTCRITAKAFARF